MYTVPTMSYYVVSRLVLYTLSDGGGSLSLAASLTAPPRSLLRLDDAVLVVVMLSSDEVEGDDEEAVRVKRLTVLKPTPVVAAVEVRVLSVVARGDEETDESLRV